MPDIFPFKAIRPVRNKVHLVSTRSYISYSKKQLQQKLDSNPYSFIHVINPEGTQSKGDNAYKFTKVREKFCDFLHQNILNQDTNSNLYIYKQSSERGSYLGVISLCSLLDYKNNLIKVHENTMVKRQQLFQNYLSITQIHAEPVLLTYAHNKEVKQKIKQLSTHRPEYEFTTADKVLHELWVINDLKEQESLQKLFKNIPSFYIADGHHRVASSYELFEATKKSKFQFFLSYLVDSEDLKVYGFNRIIKLPISWNVFYDSLKQHFQILSIQNPDTKNGIKMFANNTWFLLTPKINTSEKDVEIFTRIILQTILSVKNIRNIPWISYEPNIHKKYSYQLSENECVFMIDPVNIEEIIHYADTHKVLPPKSTWVEPKLRSALIIYEYE